MQNYNFNQWLKRKFIGAESEISNNRYVNIVGDEIENAGVGDARIYVWGIYNKYGEYINYTGQLFACFGNGIDGIPTEPNYTDYNLNSNIIDLDITSYSFNPSSGYDSASVGSVTILTENKTSSPITVCEVGIYNAMFSGSNYGWREDGTVMLYRETFEPVTLQPNETRAFTINFM